MAVHAEQHRGKRIAQGLVRRDRVRWRGAGRLRPRAADASGPAASARKFIGNGASGARAVAASSASIASERRPSRSSSTPRCRAARGSAGSRSPATSSHASKASSVPAAVAALTRCSAYSSICGASSCALANAASASFLSRRQQQCEAQRIPSVGTTRRDAAAAQQQFARALAITAQDQQSAQAEQRRLAARIDLQHAVGRPARPPACWPAARSASARRSGGSSQSGRAAPIPASGGMRAPRRPACCSASARLSSVGGAGVAERDRRAQRGKACSGRWLASCTMPRTTSASASECRRSRGRLEECECAGRVAGLQQIERCVRSCVAPAPARRRCRRPGRPPRNARSGARCVRMAKPVAWAAVAT